MYIVQYMVPFEGALLCFLFNVHVFTFIVHYDQGEMLIICLCVDLSTIGKGLTLQLLILCMCMELTSSML